MPELSESVLKNFVFIGASYFCYEFVVSGNALAPRITSIAFIDGTRRYSNNHNFSRFRHVQIVI